MLTPVHIVASASVSLAAARVFSIKMGAGDLVMLFCAELIDLDHFYAKPLYAKYRNSFKTHPLHRHWKLVLGVAIAMLTIRPLLFCGLGLIFHLFLDLVYNKIYKL